MKIAIASDLHLEFGDIILKNEQNADVLVLAGDICIAEDLHDHPAPLTPYPPEIIKTLGSRQAAAQRYRDFFSRCSFQFPYTIVIAGNHEFYHGNWYNSINVMIDECSRFPNVFFLEDMIKTIDDVTFVGSTLWTDLNKADPLTMHHVTDMMNDYKSIRNDQLGYTKLRAGHTISRHKKSLDYMRVVMEGKFDQKFVVVSHHAPTYASIHSRYKNDTIMNGAYASDLSNFILDRPQIKMWVHGHVHEMQNYLVGSTHVFCNPRGYDGYEEIADNFQLAYQEI